MTLDQSESVMITEMLKPLLSGTASVPAVTPETSTPSTEQVVVKGRGKKGKGKVSPVATAAPTKAVTTAPTPPVAASPNPTSTPKPPTPSKDESSHGRIQMVD